MNVNDLLIIIAARGGSKGLPGKNIKQLGDLPLVAWTAQAVKQSSLNQATTILSTDDPQIARIGKQFELQVPFMRPNTLATDEASAIEVALHALDWFKSQYRQEAKLIMWLQPTSPFRPPHILDDAFKAMVENNNNSDIDAVVGVKTIQRSLQTLFYLNEHNGYIEAFENSGEVISRRQAVKTCYTPNGAMYLIRSDVLRRELNFYPTRTQPLIMNSVYSHDIDDPVDWDIAQALHAHGLSWRG